MPLVEREDGRTRRQRLIDAGALIAIAALLFSGVTWLDGQRDTEAQERIAARARLGELTLELAELPVRDVQFSNELNAAAYSTASSAINVKQVVLIEQIRQLLADHVDLASASEQYSLGEALMRAGDHAAALEHLQSAKSDAETYVTAVAATRSTALSLHLLGQTEEARRTWNEALDLHREYDVAEMYSYLSNIYTLLSWSNSELATQDCARAQQLLADAQSQMGNTSPTVIGPALLGTRQLLSNNIEQSCR